MIIDRFDTPVADLRGKYLTYESVKKAVISAGRFSVWDATATYRHRKLFTKLSDDLDIELDNISLGYPWISVRVRPVPLCGLCRGLGTIERLEKVSQRTFLVKLDPCPDCVGVPVKGDVANGNSG